MELAEVKARAEAAQQARIIWLQYGSDPHESIIPPWDQEPLIDDAVALIAEVERLTAENGRLRGTLT